MPTLLAQTTLQPTNPHPPLAFARSADGWNRHLTVDGEPAWFLGNVCDTCPYLFERLPAAKRPPEPAALTSALAKGVTALADPMLATLAELMPASHYRVALFRLALRLVQPLGPDDYFAVEQVENEGSASPPGELPHATGTPYYRVAGRSAVEVPGTGGTSPTPVWRIGREGPQQIAEKPPRPNARAFDFVVPMFDPSALREACVAEYVRSLEAGAQPTAVALSVLDAKGPATCGVEHHCLAHFLVDGHHKAAAAARSGRPLTLLAFIDTRNGVSSAEDVERLLATYASADAQAD